MKHVLAFVAVVVGIWASIPKDLGLAEILIALYTIVSILLYISTFSDRFRFTDKIVAFNFVVSVPLAIVFSCFNEFPCATNDVAVAKYFAGLIAFWIQLLLSTDGIAEATPQQVASIRRGGFVMFGLFFCAALAVTVYNNLTTPKERKDAQQLCR